MRRAVFDVLRRAVDNTIANWPLIVIRIAELVLFGILTIAAVIAAILPIFMSVGIEVSRIDSPDDLESAAIALMERWMLLVWIFVAISVLVLLYIAIHAVVEAGSARVYVDAERAAGPALDGPRSRYRVFSMSRWMTGAREGWWTLFWIYNLAWGMAGLILLIPLLPTIAGMLLLRDEPPAAVATGCVGLIVTVFLMIFVGAVTGMWVNRSITEWAVHRLGPAASLSAGWAAFRADLGRHVLIFLAMFVATMAGSSFFSSLSFFPVMGGGDSGFFFLMPMQILSSLLNMLFSSIVSAWYLAAYSSLAAE